MGARRAADHLPGDTTMATVDQVRAFAKRRIGAHSAVVHKSGSGPRLAVLRFAEGCRLGTSRLKLIFFPRTEMEVSYGKGHSDFRGSLD